MEFIATAGKLILKAETELGRVYETMDGEAGEVIETRFWYNPRYLLDAAKAVKGEAVIYISAKGMLLVTAENFNFITAPIAKVKSGTIPTQTAA